MEPHETSINRLGFSTIEILVTITVLAILASIAVPMLSDLINRQRLKGAAQRVMDDYREARSIALTSNHHVYLSFVPGDAKWCYGMDDETVCNCQVSNDCTVNGKEFVVSNDNFPNVAMLQARFAGGVAYTSFDPDRGLPKDNGMRNGTVWFQAPNGEQLATVLSTTSRIRFCSPTLTEFTQCAAPTPN